MLPFLLKMQVRMLAGCSHIKITCITLDHDVFSGPQDMRIVTLYGIFGKDTPQVSTIQQRI